MRRSIQSIPEQHITDIERLPLFPIPSLPRLLHLLNQNLHMFLENAQITNTVLNKLRSDQLSRIMPLIQIRREDRVSQKVFPVSMKGLALAIICELGCEDSFDILRIGGEDDPSSGWTHFTVVQRALWGLEPAIPYFQVLVLEGSLDSFSYEVETCRWVSMRAIVIW